PTRKIHDSEEIPPAKGTGTTSLARHAGGPRRTPETRVSLRRRERSGEAGEGLGHHLHSGLREGAWSDLQLTTRSARRSKERRERPSSPEMASDACPHLPGWRGARPSSLRWRAPESAR